ncbi:carbohydrate ABC transporter permease [Paenibacillus sacheonensis]|uniref:ABC transporter permease subunit n=1 Tax=Paenibacillus sacheonensis TaxID=742054 RepID=A0A7X5BYZ0_9BACL|nr:sugar ABC transporter permease [Paenibacillus sacheonensis]MBM7563980.1 multiple sugar transport system permease protein [Paenibacillus sacheonensis]NBC67680.1 ABC transporter permease subunit [Paenibacillus sacheonensis]
MPKLRASCCREAAAVLAFLGPSLAGFLLFYVVPFGAVVYYSFVDTPIEGHYVGWDNYRQLWESASFRKAFGNSVAFAGVSVPVLFAVSLGLALLLIGAMPLRRTFRTVFLLPLVVPVASIALVWQALFHWNGAINGLAAKMGYVPVDWMNSRWSFAVMLAVYVWKNAGYNLILFLAGLASVPAEQYEAASIDGAGRWRRFRSITWPGLVPVSFFVAVMSIVGSFKVFRETYVVAGAYPNDAIYTLQHFMNNQFQSLDYSKLTSAAVLLSLVIGMTVFVLFRAERRAWEVQE